MLDIDIFPRYIDIFIVIVFQKKKLLETSYLPCIREGKKNCFETLVKCVEILSKFVYRYIMDNDDYAAIAALLCRGK